MHLYITMALCTWRKDWPPTYDAIRMSMFNVHNELINFHAPFSCRHPFQGPEEYQCHTTTNMTHTACKELQMETLVWDEFKIESENDKPFSLCRMNIDCRQKKVKYVVT